MDRLGVLGKMVAAGAVLEMGCKKIAPMAGLGAAVQEEPGSPVV